jgi:hypothetical protein
VGEWPFCPHGFSQGVSIIDDQLEGGARWCETMGHEPVWLDGTKSQWKREVDARKDSIVHVDRHDRAYYDRKFRLHDQELRDTGTNREY